MIEAQEPYLPFDHVDSRKDIEGRGVNLERRTTEKVQRS